MLFLLKSVSKAMSLMILLILSFALLLANYVNAQANSLTTDTQTNNLTTNNPNTQPLPSGIPGPPGPPGANGQDGDSFLVKDSNGDVFLEQGDFNVSNGKLSSSGSINIGHSDESCNSHNEGDLRYHRTIKNMQFCNGSTWKAFADISYLSNDPLSDRYFDDALDNPYKLGSANSWGGGHSCTLTLDNTVRCWGRNHHRQSNVPAGLRATQIAQGYAHTCALTLDHTVQCWGYNRYGQSNVPAGLRVRQIAPGGEHTCALRLDHTVQCWGNNRDGQRNVPAGLKAQQIALGFYHTCALRLDHTVQCWGYNEDGQTDVPAGLMVKQIVLGGYHNCVLKLDNTVQCWGRNRYKRSNNAPIDGRANAPAGLIAKQL